MYKTTIQVHEENETKSNTFRGRRIGIGRSSHILELGLEGQVIF